MKIGCFIFGHKWKFAKRQIVERPMFGRVYVEDVFIVYNCPYCRQTVMTTEKYRPSNRRREKWEKFSETLKAIFR